jgi:hypothetical protein
MERREQLEDLVAGERIILKLTLKKWDMREWIGYICLRKRDPVNTIVKFHVPSKGSKNPDQLSGYQFLNKVSSPWSYCSLYYG